MKLRDKRFIKIYRNIMKAILFIIPLLLSLSAIGQGVINNYKASWVGNSFGHAPGAKWVQNYINEIKVEADGTVYTKSHWDEGGRKFGVYKDGDVIGNQSVVIDGKSVSINGKTWTFSGNVINGPGGKKITDSVVFTYRLFDQFGYPIEEQVSWEVLGGGSISEAGIFFPETTGTVYIVASNGHVYDTVTVSVYAPDIKELKIHPDDPMLYAGKELQLHIRAYDQFDSPLLVEVEWELLAGEGTIDEHGNFKAGHSPGKSRVAAKSGEISDTLDITVILPTNWVNRDIGEQGRKGTAEMDLINDMFEVSASGSDIWGNSDQFHYVYKPLDGDGRITARIDAFNVTDSWAKVGLMIRATDNQASSHASVFITGSNGAVCQYRTMTAGGSSNVSADIQGVAAPYWLKLDRTGNHFTAYLSADGIVWDAFHQFSIEMPDTVLIGLAATSHNNNSTLTATYSHVVSQGFDPVRVGGLSLDTKSLDLIVGTTRPLKATLTPNNPTINTILWQSTNNQVARVNQSGLVSALREGEAFIVATSLDGAYSESCPLFVRLQQSRPSTDPGFEREQLTLHPVWNYEGDIVIDGIANEAFWGMIEPIELNHDVTNAWWTEGSKPIDPKYKESGDYHLSWRATMDEEFFYIFCEIIDDDLQSRSMHTGGEYHEVDNIELYFCFSEDCCPGDWCGFDYFAAVRIFADLNEQTGDTLTAWGMAGGIAGNESYQPMGYKSRTVITPKGYNIEARIPFELIIPAEDGRYGDYNDNGEWIDIVITDLKPFLFDITGNDLDEGKEGPTGSARHLIANWSANWNRNWYSTEGYGIATMGETLFPDDTNIIIQSARNIHIYPNPSSETISIRDTRPDSRISIFTILGQEVYHRQTTSDDTQLDISSLKNGIYLVHVIDRQGNQAIGRFVKQ